MAKIFAIINWDTVERESFIITTQEGVSWDSLFSAEDWWPTLEEARKNLPDNGYIYRIRVAFEQTGKRWEELFKKMELGESSSFIIKEPQP